MRLALQFLMRTACFILVVRGIWGVLPSTVMDSSIAAAVPLRRLAASDVVSSCPDDEGIVRAWSLGYPTEYAWTVVNVGVNKGHAVMDVLYGLGMAGNFTFTKLIEHNAQAMFVEGCHNNPDVFCGSCHECANPRPAPSARGGRVDVTAYDGQRLPVEILRRFFTSTTNQTFRFRHAALSDHRGTATFRQGLYGDELSAIGGGGPRVRVAPMSAEGFKRVDVLLTDCEGHDFDVAWGARELFERGRVGIHLFEIGTGRGGFRPDEKLRRHLKRAKEWGYECFVPLYRPANHTLAYIDEEGMDSKQMAQLAGWVNGLCVNRRMELAYKALMEYGRQPAPPRPRKKPPKVLPRRISYGKGVQRLVGRRIFEANCTYEARLERVLSSFVGIPIPTEE